MILHLVTKHFFSNNDLSVFENRAPGQNIVLVIGSLSNSVEFVDNGIEVTNDNADKIVESLDFNCVNHVVIHFLTAKIADFVRSYIPKGLPIYWSTYGGDLYFPFLQPRGFDIFYNDLNPFRYGFLYMFKRHLRTSISRILFRFGIKLKNQYMQSELLDRICGIIPCINEDHQEACKYLKRDFKLVRVHPSGYPSFEEKFYEGNIISIGHNASVSNNHLYALKYMSKIDVNNSIISLTLSYNCTSEEYVSIVKKRFKKFYKENVQFVEKMLSREDYFTFQNKVKIMIMPSWRQEGLGNIVSAFLRGIKVFLSKKSPMYRHFNDYGFIVFAIEDINQPIFDKPLTIEEKMFNRKMIIKYMDERARIIDLDFENFFGDFTI